MRLLLTAVLLVHAGAALAESPEADRLFEEGRELAKTGNFTAACERFARSFEIEQGAGTEANLADCQERLGNDLEAHRLFVNAATRWEASNDLPRAKYARDRAATLVATRLATVVIGVREPTLPNLAISLNGRAVAPAAEIRELVAPGAVEILATAPGRARFTRTQTLRAGSTAVVELALEPPAVAPYDRSARNAVSVGLAIGAAATLGTSTTLALIARRNYNATVATHCDASMPRHCDAIGVAEIERAQSHANIATGLAIAGAALAIASGVLYVTGRHEVAITPTATGATASLSGRF